MARANTIFAMLVSAAIAGCSAKQPSQNGLAETAGPQFAVLCLKQSEWPRLLASLKRFGLSHNLSVHGGIDPSGPNGATMFNVYLSQGYSFYFGDDFDLWFTSDPFRPGVLYLNGVLKRKPITAEQSALAMSLLSEVAGLTTAASGPQENPRC
jgi:hypothetical protein